MSNFIFTMEVEEEGMEMEKEFVIIYLLSVLIYVPYLHANVFQDLGLIYRVYGYLVKDE